MFEDFTWMMSDCEELVGEVNHTTEYVTDLFSFVDVEWLILLINLSNSMVTIIHNI